ncbi:MAG: hypothetical protein Q9O62_14680 [Ardenticatenia bacterium]|nr:hypothetical protein [Ardenticatenia bacterium]
METLVTLHDLWRWVVLIAFGVAVLSGLRKWHQGAEWRVVDRRWPLVATVTLDIQVLLGIVIWAGQGRWTGDHPFFTTWLHPMIMLVALGVAHATLSRSRRLRGPAQTPHGGRGASGRAAAGPVGRAQVCVAHVGGV